MLLLHISDIHFREPDCLDPHTDPERPYRTLLLQDARKHAHILGSVGAILVGGDIAFKGDPKEYEVAATWLKELADATGCSLARIFTVPGNHDVDRRIIASTPSVRNAQLAIARTESQHRERELRTQFADPDTSRALLQPLAAYNEFAKFFSCQVYSPDHLYWKQDLPLTDGVHLRLHGLTSVLLSGQHGKNDVRGSLYLSRLQTVLDPADNVVNLVLMHHPPDWLMDGDDVDDAIRGRAALHLFGHKHRQRIVQAQDYVRYSAGAVNPDPNENSWLPGYNIIETLIEGNGSARVLEVRSHLMQWQTNPDRFRPVVTKQDNDVFLNHIAIPTNVDATKVSATPSTVAVLPNSEKADVEVTMSDEGTRNLIFRFWKLRMSDRREIAQALGLLEDAEWALPEPERYGRALLRAGERKLLNRLAQEVASRERH